MTQQREETHTDDVCVLHSLLTSLSVFMSGIILLTVKFVFTEILLSSCVNITAAAARETKTFL